MPSQNHDLHLVFEHNVIEHLGVKLYQNKPTNVLAELVSNSWDADADNIWITTSQEFVTFADDGKGMTYEDIRDIYLHIGKTTRDLNDLSKRTLIKQRPIMAKKGIGKLAVFGISKELTLFTVSNSLVNMININLNNMDNGVEKEKIDYQPNLLIDKQKLDSNFLALLPSDYKHREQIEIFLQNIKHTNQTGTLLILDNLSTSKKICKEQICQSLVRRFCGIFDSNEAAHINLFFEGEQVTPSLSFDFRIPEEGYQEHTLESGKKIKFYIGFKGKPEWSTEQAGIGVYTNQKIAQDRFFAFHIKGREVFTRYMFGVIQADWLDLIKPDVISTDRTNLDWDNRELVELYDWGQKEIAEAINLYKAFREKQDRENFVAELSEARKQGKSIPVLSSQEEGDIADILAKVTSAVPEEKKEEIQNLALNSWINEPAWIKLLNTWKSLLSNNNIQAEDFIRLMKDLQEKAVFCSMTLATVIAQKIYALMLLQKMCSDGKEQDLQHLLEDYPWILNPSYDKYQANKSIKKFTIEQYQKRYKVEENDGLKPDFIFYSEYEENILVIELKNPQENLEQKNFTQLSMYMNLLKEKFPNRQINGILIGHNTAGICTELSPIIVVKDWDEIIKESFDMHASLLKTVIEKTPVSGQDSRIDRIMPLIEETNIVDFIKGIRSLGNQHVQDVLSKYDEYLSPKKVAVSVEKENKL